MGNISLIEMNSLLNHSGIDYILLKQKLFIMQLKYY